MNSGKSIQKRERKLIQGVEDLVPDPRNPNIGSERGQAVIENSLRQLGAGRSIVTDKNGVVIAGNKTLESAAELGLPIETVHTSGDKLVVVVRDDLDLMKDERARRLSIVDNRASEISLNWDTKILKELPPVIIEDLWTEKEWAKLLGYGENSDSQESNSSGGKEVICPECGAHFEV